MLKKVKVVVFDFDGTLSAYDSNVEFAKYCFQHSVRPWAYIPLMAITGLARIFNPAGLWWRTNIRRFITPDMIKKFKDDFVESHRQNRFGWAKDQVVAEQKRGNVVVLVSASPDYLVRALVKDMPFDAVICSQMDTEKPWRYKFLCWGKNKVIAFDAWAKQQNYIPHIVRAYSDSKSDLPIMELADEQVWINRKTGTRI